MCGEGDAELAAQAAQDDDRQYRGGLDEGETFWAYEGLAGGEERAGETAEHRRRWRRPSAWYW